MKTLLALLLAALLVPAQAKNRPPNFVVVLIDDMGATDLGFAGSKYYDTPHIDRLAADGVRFTRAYSACTVCSPTRAALLTGKSPARLHLTDWIAGHEKPKAKLRTPDWTKELLPAEETLAESLRAVGYATASIGKWHLGPAMPETQGFDVNIGGTEKGQPPSYFAPYKIPTLPEGPDGEFLSERLTAEAERWMEAHKDRPFFLYLPHFAVHTPLDGKKEVVAKYAAKPDRQGVPKYAALVESVDDSIGRLRAKIEALGLADDTILIFTSDNGGLRGDKNPTTINLGLRAGKGSAYEGGVRIPLVVWGGGPRVRGARAVDTRTITMDLHATLRELAGLPPAPIADGNSLAAVLRGEKPGDTLLQRPLYWHYPHYHPGGATPYSALVEGSWRLVEFYEDQRAELYDLTHDPEEMRDLSTTQPARTAELRAKLAAWRKSVAAQDPTPNPNYTPPAPVN